MKSCLLIFISFIFLTLVNLQIYFDSPSALDKQIFPRWINIDQGKTLVNNMAIAQEDDKKFISGFNTGSYPVGITMNPITNKIYVANQYSNTVSVFDAKTDRLISTIRTGYFLTV
jgi:YVTN family beta-propeller protein